MRSSFSQSELLLMEITCTRSAKSTDTDEAHRSHMKLTILGLSFVLLISSCASSPSVKMTSSSSQPSSAETPSFTPEESQDKIEIYGDCIQYWVTKSNAEGWRQIAPFSKNCNYILYSTAIDPSMNYKERINDFEECLKLKAKELEDRGINQFTGITKACSRIHLVNKRWGL